MSEQKEYGELTIDKLMTNTGLTDEQVNQEIAGKDLSKIADLFDNIDDLCEQFGLSAAEKTDVEKLQHISTKNSTKKALKYWRNRFPYKATFKNLLIILLDNEKGGVAKDVADYISNKPQPRKTNKQQPRPGEGTEMLVYAFMLVLWLIGAVILLMVLYNQDRSPILTMTDFEQYKENDTVWHSPPVYTHPQGYKIFLRVYPNSWGKAKGTHITVGVYFMRGEFDDSLKWPFQGTIYFKLIDQLHGKYHWEQTVSYKNMKDKWYGDRVTVGDWGWGEDYFLQHHKLKPNNYLLDNTLKFQIHRCFLF